MKKNVPSLRVRACLLAVAALSTPALRAQVPTLAETRVTATRFAEPAEPLPLGVSVVTADEIRASGAASVNDALMRVLGLQGRQDLYGGGEYNLDLRGFGIAADNNQVVILDGVRISEADQGGTRLSAIPIDTVERIEVLRGSGAVLYGEGATGGVIVITTKAYAGRQQDSGASLYAAAGSYGLRDLRASATARNQNGLGLDASVQTRRSDGYRAHSKSDLDTAAVTGRWSNEWLLAGVRLAQDDLHVDLPGALSDTQYAADPRQAGNNPGNAAIRGNQASVFAQAQLGAWELALDAGQRRKRLRSVTGGFPFDYDIAANSYAVRAKHTAAWRGMRNALVIGSDLNEWRRETLGNAPATAQQRSLAWYLKDDLTLAGGTRLSLGARTEKADKSNTSSASGFADRGSAWELGASHPLARSLTGYARVGRSFRLANVDEFNFTTPGLVLVPQVSTDLEAGVRWSGAASRMEARVFRSRLSNEIGFDPNAAGPFSPFGFNGANVNFDPTLRQGVEVDWHRALNAALGVRVNAVVREATFRSGPYSGKDVPLVPRKLLAVRADWRPVAGHRVDAGLSWVSSQHPDFANACRMPSYLTADARYAWAFQRNAELALGVTNLLDRKYYTYAFGCNAVGHSTSSLYPEAGRALAASLRLQF